MRYIEDFIQVTCAALHTADISGIVHGRYENSRANDDMNQDRLKFKCHFGKDDKDTSISLWF